MTASTTTVMHQPEHPPSHYDSTLARHLIERCVLVTRQSDGYGLTVTGEHPVFVCEVKSHGAAFIAGVRAGDQVLKVNGMPVTGSNYQEVLRMISGGCNLALTLLSTAQFSYFSADPSLDLSDSGDCTQFYNADTLGYRRFGRSDFSTLPRHENFDRRPSVQSNMTEPIFNRHELHRMLNKERRHLEILRQSDNCDDLRRSGKFERALRRIDQLQEQLEYADEHDAGCSTTLQSVKSGAPPSAPPSLVGDHRSHAYSRHTHNRRDSHNHRPTGPASVVSGGSLSAEPVKSWVESGGLHYVQSSGGTSDLRPMEEEGVDEEVDRNVGDNSGPFSNLIDLKSRPAHLAVFISYLVNNSNPNSLLFYLISDAFQATANIKELRRFAYEIFSTFIIPNAPLQLPDVKQPMFQQIDKALRVASPGGSSQDVEQLRRLFLPARTRAIGNINERLAQFRRRRALSAGGGDASAIDGVDARQLEAARTDHGVSTKIAEQVLFRLLDGLVAQCNGNVSFDGDMPDGRKLALVASLATIIKVMGLRNNYTPWEKLLEKCPTFVTSSRSTMLSKMKPKRSVQVKDHQFSLNPVCLTTACYQCRDVFWGVNPQAYFCQYCDVVVHKQCTTKLIDHCYPVAAQQQKRSTGNVGAAAARAAPTTAATTNPRPVPPAVSASSVSLDATRVHGVGTPDAIDYDRGMASGSTTNVYGGYYQHQSRISAPDSYLSIGSSSGDLMSPSARQKATSVTPPLCRSHASTATIVGSMTGGGPRAVLGSSRSHLNYAVDDEPDDDAEAESELIAHIEGGAGGMAPAVRPLPSVHTATAATTSSSPASSSKSMLPPLVFSHKFERITPPQPPTVNDLASAQPPNVPRAVALAAAAAASESSDSGIDNEMLLVGADGHAISRAHSMKVEASSSNQSSQIRRNGRGANSLGAADSPTGSASTLVSAAPALANAVASPLTRDFTQSRTAASTKSNINLFDAAGQQFPAGLVVAPQCISVAPSLHHHASTVESEASALRNSLTASTSTLRVITPSTVAPSPAATITTTSAAPSSNAAEIARQLTACVERTVIADGDSDLDVETEVPSLESLLSWEVLRHLKPKEKKRQEVMNEFFHTERTHLRNLKILYKLFYRPMVLQKIESPELIHLLFGNLDALLRVHSEMYAKMQTAVATWRQQFAAGTLTLAGGVTAIGAEGTSETASMPSSTAQATASGGSAPPYGNIGELVESIFAGDAGERLMSETALFCQNQQYALDTLRQRYNRSSKEDAFSAFLAEAECNPLCRKLQLKDMIPVEMQRLVKYPLLLETIAKYTPDPSDELTRLLHGATCAKRILSAVNTAKRNAENRRRLEELQKRVDFSALDKFAAFFQKFDFRNHRLIYEGTLLWRQARGKTVELHVVLLDHLLVFLTRLGGDGTPSGGPNVRWQLKVAEAGCLPIMRLSYVEVEEKSVDKRTFNLLYKCDLRLFELIAPTATERKTWHRLIENQIAVSNQDMPTTGEELSHFFNVVATAGGVPGATATTTKAADGSTQALSGVEQVHVLTHPNLVTANQIVVEQPRILEHAQLEHAPPSPQAQLGPVERLRRFDKVILNSLSEKHAILMEMLKEDTEETDTKDLEKIADLLAGLSVAELKHRNTRELAVSTIVFGNRLLDSINTGMTSVSGIEAKDRALPSVPCYKLTSVAAPLMNHIKALTQLVQEQEQQRPQPQRQSSSGDLSASASRTKTQMLTIGSPPPTAHRNNCVGIAAALIGDDDGAPPPLPPSSAPPPLD